MSSHHDRPSGNDATVMYVGGNTVDLAIWPTALKGSNTLCIFLGQQATYSVHLHAANSVYAHTSAFSCRLSLVQTREAQTLNCEFLPPILRGTDASLSSRLIWCKYHGIACTKLQAPSQIIPAIVRGGVLVSCLCDECHNTIQINTVKTKTTIVLYSSRLNWEKNIFQTVV